MKRLTQSLERVGSCVLLGLNTIKELPSIYRQFPRILFHCYHTGYKTFPIVGILSIFIGGVLALQTGFSIDAISGAETFLGSIVGLSMARELGPVMASFLVAGRVGSATAAELASMKVYSEVDALKTMNLSPAGTLVLPRMIAITIMMPALTIFSIIIGWFGGMLVSHYVAFISLDQEVYWQGLKNFVVFDSVKDGLIKAECFGIAVMLISCNEGLQTEGGPREIGNAVTRAVVVSMITILFLDYFVTKATL